MLVYRLDVGERDGENTPRGCSSRYKGPTRRDPCTLSGQKEQKKKEKKRKGRRSHAISPMQFVVLPRASYSRIYDGFTTHLNRLSASSQVEKLFISHRIIDISRLSPREHLGNNLPGRGLEKITMSTARIAQPRRFVTFHATVAILTSRS